MKNYFPHDSNARSDEKIVLLRIKHGWAGYGIYWALIEKLRGEPTYQLKEDYDVLAYDLRADPNLVKAVINDFDLFIIENNLFYSKSLLVRMKAYDEKSEKARQSAKKRWDKEHLQSDINANALEENANALQTQCESDANKIRLDNINISHPAHTCEGDFEIDLTKCYYALDNNQSWKETICMNTRIVHKNFTPDDLTQHLKAFFRKLQNEGEKAKTPRDAMSHFARWLESKLNTKNDGKPRRKTDIQPREKTQKNYSGGF